MVNQALINLIKVWNFKFKPEIFLKCADEINQSIVGIKTHRKSSTPDLVMVIIDRDLAEVVLLLPQTGS